MRAMTVGLSQRHWAQPLAAWAGAAGWSRLGSLREYCPRRGDRLLGFFSVSELSLLERFGVQAWTLTLGDIVLPDEQAALRCAGRVEVRRVQVQALQAPALVPPTPRFMRGPDALLRSTALRRARGLTS